MSDPSLFSEFNAVSAKQWKQKIQYDLKGADYNDTLLWESLEGIHIKPFYTGEDLENIPSHALPEEHTWNIGQKIYCDNVAQANKKVREALDKGATAVILEVPEANTDWQQLFAGVSLESAPVYLEMPFLETSAPIRLLEDIEGKSAKLYFNLDPIVQLAKTGNWFVDYQNDHQILEEIATKALTAEIGSVLGVDTSCYQNAGANMVQQLAYGMAHANEYLNYFANKDSALLKSVAPITFKVAVGGNYFFEIAKIKALRWLWESLSSSYGLSIDCHILASPSKRNKTLYDYNVNILRTTSECMASVLGGANTVYNLPYDAIYHKDNSFGERIARNQLLLLKEESYFDEALLASEGSYYIGALTEQLAYKALALFKQIEASGGFLNALKKGSIQKKIKESAAQEQELFDTGELVLLGTNKYQNPEDQMKDHLELRPFVEMNKRKTLLEPIIERRLAEDIEQKRLENE